MHHWTCYALLRYKIPDFFRNLLANAREVVELYAQDLVDAGETIPVEQGTIELPEPAVVVNV